MRKKRMENPSTQAFFGQPDDCFAMINQYGTYNIQPTADADAPFPAIAQGLPRSLIGAAQKASEQTRKTYGAKMKPEE